MSQPPAPPDITTRVRAALAELALPSPDDIAARLAELGCKGVQADECGCPVAVYLSRLDPRWVVEVRSAVAEIFFGDGELDRPVLVGLPEIVSWFVERFDHGAYPELIADVAPAVAS